MDNKPFELIPYLSFDGKCAEALDLYAELFGEKIVMKMTYGEMPPEMAGGMPIPEEAKGRVMNEMLALPGGGMLFGGDTPPGRPHTPMTGVRLMLNFATVDEAQKVFDGLADGGEVEMPLAPTFWAERFGLVTDKFGIAWGVNGNVTIRP